MLKKSFSQASRKCRSTISLRIFSGIALAIGVVFSNGAAQAQSNRVATALAAQAFLATLSQSQSNAVVYAPTLANAGNWSNFPDYEATRNGLIFLSFNETQRTAALNVAYTALSA